jgi:hypothetical protein
MSQELVDSLTNLLDIRFGPIRTWVQGPHRDAMLLDGDARRH